MTTWLPADCLINVTPDDGDESVRVELIEEGGEGHCYVAQFSGPESHGRARQYAHFLNDQRRMCYGSDPA